MRLLVLSIIAATLNLYSSHAKAADDEIANISAAEVKLQDSAYVVLDVRTPAEFESGHIQGAVNVNINEESFSKRIATFDPSKTYIVHCAANVPNGRSAKAIQVMQGLGFNQVLSLEGGVAAWTKAGRALVE
ncbi:MAG: rhodanese-like domain-containing protein [Pseudomonadota bacterium]